MRYSASLVKKSNFGDVDDDVHESFPSQGESSRTLNVQSVRVHVRDHHPWSSNVRPVSVPCETTHFITFVFEFQPTNQ